MVDGKFGSLVDQLKQAHEVAQAQAQQTAAEERDQRHKNIERQVESLRLTVRPVLDDVKAQVEKRGIPIEIIEEFNVYNYVNRRPALSISAVGPERATQWGGKVTPKSKSLWFLSDGVKIEAFLNENYNWGGYSDGKSQGSKAVNASDLQDWMAECIKTMLQSYFDNLDGTAA